MQNQEISITVTSAEYQKEKKIKKETILKDGADAKQGPRHPPLEHHQSPHDQPSCSRRPYLSGIYII